MINPIAIDFGTSRIRAGYMGSEYPVLEVASVTQNENYPFAQPILNDGKIEDLELTKLAIERILQIIYSDVFKTEKVCDFSKIPAIILTFAFVNSTLNSLQQNLLEWLISDCNIPKCQIVESSRMLLFGTGRISGLVLDMGLDSSRITPIIDGQRLSESLIDRFPIGGSKLTETLKYLIQKDKNYVYFPLETADVLKKKSCFVSQDFSKDMKLYRYTSAFVHPFKLPDGFSLAIDKERFIPSEIFFSPENYSVSGKYIDYELTLQEAIGKAFLNAPMDIRKVLLQSMVLGGGPSLMPGLDSRLNKEVHSWYQINILGNRNQSDNFERHYVYTDARSDLSAFRGVSLQGALNVHNNHSWYTKELFEEGFRTINF